MNLKKKIVVLEGAELNPGDLAWEDLYALGDTTVFENTVADQLIERAADAEVLVVNKLLINEVILQQLPHLKYIAVSATGYNCIDMAAAEKHGILVSNIPAYSTESVAQMVFAHLLNITSQVGLHNQLVKSGEWTRRQVFSFTSGTNYEIAGMTMGIVGFGHTGQAVARIAQGFGLQVMVYTSKEQSQLPDGVRKATNLKELFQSNQIISLHCPLTKQTQHIINKEHLDCMPEGAILINTGRGGLVDEQALAHALSTGKLLAAGVDVLSQEPPMENNPLLHTPNCYITPHNAWATLQARRRMLSILIDNISTYNEGHPQNIVH